MTTISNSTLPIPDQVIVGSGSYTIPANRYGFFQFSTAISGGGWTHTNSNGYNSTTSGPGQSQKAPFQVSSSSNSGQQWLREGDSISTTQNTPTTNTGTTNNVIAMYFDAYSYVLLNGVVINASRASGGVTNKEGTNFNSFGYYGVRFTSNQGWSVSLYRIPKANLPAGAAEGE